MEWEQVGRRKRPRKSLHNYSNSVTTRLNQQIHTHITPPTLSKTNKKHPFENFANQLLMLSSSPPSPPPSSSSSSSSSSSGVAQTSDLPCSILIDILGRLPLKTLIDCRYVCKLWRSLLTEPYFNRLYSHHMPTTLILQVKGNSLNTLKEIYVIDQETPPRDGDGDGDGYGGPRARKMRLTTSSSSESATLDFRYQLGNGCNGLVCLRDIRTREPSMVWNPVMGQFVVLPKPATSTDDKVVAGLGFCARTNRYKVLRIFHGLNDPPEKRRAEVYDLGVGNEWREIGEVPFHIPSRIPGFFTNNSLHWILDDPNFDNKNDNNPSENINSNVELICGFDFGEEKFKEVAAPPIFSDEKNKYHWSNLGIIAGCLSISAIDATQFRPDIQVWVMEEYGVPESWALRLSIRDPVIEWWDPYRWIQVTNILRNGDIVMLCAHCYVLAYNLRERKFGKEEWLGFPAIAHVPSLISLEDVLSDSLGTGSLNVRYL